jgi:type I restriction enzyme S subunit
MGENKDVLLNITGASIGRVAVFEGADDEANVNQHVCIIRIDKEMLNPDYLMYLLATENYQNKIIGNSSGGTREAFTFEQIKQFDIALPPKEHQGLFS